MLVSFFDAFPSLIHCTWQVANDSHGVASLESLFEGEAEAVSLVL